MNIFKTAILVFGLLMAGACATPESVQKTSLELQAFQAKEFESSKDLAFAATMSVFQDLGYIVASADKDTGFITAASPAGAIERNFWEAFRGTKNTKQTKATAFIEEIRPGFSSVRLNFVSTTLSSAKKGQTYSEDSPVLDPRAYQIAFSKIDDAIFVREASSPSK